jgi:hypothetical protein
MYQLLSLVRDIERGGPMAVLVCSCTRGGNLWGEFWWIGQGYQWVFFDDDETSETYTEQITHCTGCGRPLDRKNLRMTTAFTRLR